MPKRVRFYLTTVGRISRKALWLAVILPLSVITLVAGIVDTLFWPNSQISVFGSPYSPTSLAFSILVLWPSFATAIRRFHDLNTTGWWVLAFVPIYLWTPDLSQLFGGAVLSSPGNAVWAASFVATIVLAVMQLIQRGTRGQNRYGPDPLAQ